MEERKLRKGEKIYLVCDDNPNIFPNNQLGVFKTEKDALNFVGEYVIYKKICSYTQYIKIKELSIGKPEYFRELGVEELENGE